MKFVGVREREARADFLITGDEDLLSLSQESLKKNEIPYLIVLPKTFWKRCLKNRMKKILS